jgi:hypothetical protein
MSGSIFHKRRRKIVAFIPLKSTSWNWCAHLGSRDSTIVSARGVATLNCH